MGGVRPDEKAASAIREAVRDNPDKGLSVGPGGRTPRGPAVSPTVHPGAIRSGMFSRLTILLFVFFAVAGLLRVTAPATPGMTRDDQAEALAPPGLTIGRIIAERTSAQP
jgi:hypothetical protein